MRLRHIALLAVALAGCNPYGMQFGVRCGGGVLEVEARNPTGEAWDWRTDLDPTWHLSRPGSTTVVPQRSAPARITITTAGPSGQPDAVETLATGC